MTKKPPRAGAPGPSRRAPRDRTHAEAAPPRQRDDTSRRSARTNVERGEGRPARGGQDDRAARDDRGARDGAPPRRGRPVGPGHAPPKDEPGIKNPYVRFRPLKKPPVAVHPTTLWDYPSQHYGKSEQGSQGYRGATPSHVIWNLLKRYTKEGDLVVDPFCGSGTTLDVCRDLGRRGRGCDLAPTRPEIVRGDARKLSTIVDRETAHLVFFDPPYADNLAYSDDPACIGKLAFEDGSWSRAMGEVLDEVKKVLKPGGIAAGFVSDILHVAKKSVKEGGRTHQRVERTFGALGFELQRLALARGFTMLDHVAVVRHGRALEDPRLKARAQDEGFLLRGFSHLVIFEKPAKSAPTSSSRRG